MQLARASVSKMMAIGVVAAMCSLAVTVPAFADEGTDAPSAPSFGESSGGISLMANTTDTTFTFDLASGTTAATGYRAKQDTSSTYVNAQYLGAPCQLFVDGTGGVNCTVNDRAYLNRTGQFAIRQNVYEWGYRSARLTGWRSGYGTIANGLWSPDSWGSYPVINAGF